MPSSITTLQRLLLAVCLLAGAAASAQSARSATPIASIAASDQSVTVKLGQSDREVELFAIGVHQPLSTPAPALWGGRPNGQRVELQRFDPAKRDRVFHRFMLRDKQTGRAIGRGRFVDDLDALTADGSSEPWPEGIKGIQAPLINQDMIELGVSHITDNISIATLINGVAGPDHDPEFTYTVDGVAYAFRPDQVRQKDKLYKFMHDHGINVLSIILCYISETRNPNSPLYREDGKPVELELAHPGARPDEMVQNLTAVNLSTEEGQRQYRAVMGFLAQRYSRPDNRYGRLGGHIISNEVNSHWVWHHMGEVEPLAVIRQYAEQLRLSYYAIRQHDPDPQVFISMDHYWTHKHGASRKRYMPGREFLDRFAAEMAATGDLPWHVAQHPYPENLFDPAFWDDETAWSSYDSPRITYNNVEVLVGYMQRPQLLYEGEQRTLILSEQGFHAGKTEESERVQAAAYALAHYKLSNLPGVRAHVLHRHTDHPDEGGLLLGVRACDPQGRPTHKRLMFDVFAAADTDRQEEVFRFALPIIGIDSWEQAMPSTGPFPSQRAAR